MTKTSAIFDWEAYSKIEKIKEIRRELKKCLKEVFIQIFGAPVLSGFISCLIGSFLDLCLGWEMTSIIPVMVVVAVAMMVWQGNFLAKDVIKAITLISQYKEAMR